MTTRLNVALPNVPGIKSLLLGPASPSRFDISTCSYKWKRNAMENRHDMPLSSLLLFLFPSILISISRIPSNRRSFTLPLFTHFILRICQRFRSIDITQLRLFLPSFLIYSHFSVIRITLFQIYPDRRPNFSSIFLSLSRISLLQRFLSNHFSPFFPFSIYFYLCSIISIF